MKKLLLIPALSACLFGGFYNLKPFHITKDITCVIGDFNPPTKENLGFVSNMCYVDIGDSLVALDAGPTYAFAKEFYDIVKKEYPKKEVKAVVLTNFHDDRVLGASFFKEIGAKIIGYKNLNDEIKKYKSKFNRMPKAVSKEVYSKTQLVYADTLVDDSYEIKGSKKSLKIIKPSKVSEEASDIAIYSKDDSFLFVGNIVFNDRMLNYREESDINGWIEALNNLTKVNAKYLLGGHGDSYTKDSYKTTLKYLQTVKKGVEKAVKEDIDDADLIKFIDTKSFETLKHFKALNYRVIHNYYEQLQWK